MPEFLDDPSVLTKDKLKSELLAHNVELPSGNPNKDVYVQLYLKKLTSLNSRSPAMTLDAFSSDEELPPPVVSNRSRSSGKKTSRKQEKVVAEELDVTSLTDEGLRDELLKHGVEAGPIVASTRKLYERKLQKLLDEDNDDKELTRPPIVNCIVTEIQVTSHNHNGNSETDLYSDKEDEVTPEPDPEPEPVVEPEPVPVVEKPVRSRGKIAVTTRTGSSQHHTHKKVMEKEGDGDKDEEPVTRVKRKSRRLSHRMMVLEDHCPAEADQVESGKKVSRLASPLFTDHLYFSSKSDQLQQEQVFHPEQDLHKRPIPHLNTMTDKSISCICEKEVPRPKLTVKPSRPTSLFTHLGTIDPATFNSLCHIPPIIKMGPERSLTQSGEKAVDGAVTEERSLSPQMMLHKQQKITRFMSKQSPTKTSHQGLPQTKEAFVRPVEKIAASDQTKVDESDVLKELFPNDLNSPSGLSVTCRRPIRGAAGRPVKHSDLWNNENFHFSPKITKTTTSSSSYTESHISNRVSSPPVANSTNSSSSSKILAAAPPAGRIKAARSSMSMWKKLFMLVILGAFVFLVYQNMETNSVAPFVETEAAGGGSA
ncbi:thymopoietin a isoform X1 [Synchiropus splendidus]|uniref:thymopoietin a isoform X1 n=1 Tax=Synchiropus splendidus TaxID=270530 RepID=UPI00237EDB7F|nr:thymopoietin a isoform X1 [Synchiropus splendidus]